MRGMNRLRAAALALVVAPLVALPVLTACSGEAGATKQPFGDQAGARRPPFYVASFSPGRESPEEQKYVLTPSPFTPSPQLGTATAPIQTPPTTPAPDPRKGSAAATTITWVNDGQYLAVITYGDGCPDGPQSIDVIADQEIKVGLGPLYPRSHGVSCDAYWAPSVTVVDLPHEITPTLPLRARLGAREVTIPAVSH